MPLQEIAEKYQVLYNLMYDEHGLILTIPEMDEIILSAQKANEEICNFAIRDLRNGKIINDFPDYGKHDLSGSSYGSLIVTKNNRVLYFFSYSDDIQFEDVTQHFEFVKTTLPTICRKCKGNCFPSKALINPLCGVSEWSDGDMIGATLNASSDAVMVDCLKCEHCGHSYQ
jgi:hypothetical protein